MKKLLSIMALLVLAGCGSARSRYMRDDLNTLKTQVDILRADISTLARDQRRLIRNLDDLGEKVASNDIDLKYRLDRRLAAFGDNLGVLEKFKADHDKRWPPPVKLLKKK